MTTTAAIALAVVAWFHFISAETNLPNVEPVVAPVREAVADSVGDFHIVGGGEVMRCSEPHQVALQIRRGGAMPFCGGSLISDSWILTAGHCVKYASHVVATLGAHDLSDDEITKEHVDIKKIVLHPGYTENLRNDIALLQMVKSVVLDGWSINPIRLPSKSQQKESFYGQQAIMTGWGRESDKSTVKSSVLRSVTSNVISNFYCGLMTLNIMPGSQICVSGFRGKGTCKGDSGGPLYVVENGTKTLIGVTSWGSRLCEWYLPSVFTRVTYYLDWIHNVTGITPRP